MEEKKLLAELKRNCEKNQKKLADLMKLFDLAELGQQIQEQRCKDVYNKVLAENEFYASRDIERTEIKVGERITDEKFDFLLSDEDFDRLQSLAQPIFVAEGISDENGCFVEKWCEMKIKARKELVEFIIQKIVPKEMRETFWEAKYNIVQMDKLINLMRSIA